MCQICYILSITITFSKWTQARWNQRLLSYKTIKQMEPDVQETRGVYGLHVCYSQQYSLNIATEGCRGGYCYPAMHMHVFVYIYKFIQMHIYTYRKREKYTFDKMNHCIYYFTNICFTQINITIDYTTYSILGSFSIYLKIHLLLSLNQSLILEFCSR